jgi:hypothetical protein
MTSKADLIPLSEGELAALIHASRPGRAVRATYPGGDLIVGADTKWALPVLAKMRGMEVSPELEAELSK